jgi:hypothetical protein
MDVFDGEFRSPCSEAAETMGLGWLSSSCACSNVVREMGEAVAMGSGSNLEFFVVQGGLVIAQALGLPHYSFSAITAAEP